MEGCYKQWELDVQMPEGERVHSRSGCTSLVGKAWQVKTGRSGHDASHMPSQGT